MLKYVLLSILALSVSSQCYNSYSSCLSNCIGTNQMCFDSNDQGYCCYTSQQCWTGDNCYNCNYACLAWDTGYQACCAQSDCTCTDENGLCDDCSGSTSGAWIVILAFAACCCICCLAANKKKQPTQGQIVIAQNQQYGNTYSNNGYPINTVTATSPTFNPTGQNNYYPPNAYQQNVNVQPAQIDPYQQNNFGNTNIYQQPSSPYQQPVMNPYQAGTGVYGQNASSPYQNNNPYGNAYQNPDSQPLITNNMGATNQYGGNTYGQQLIPPSN